MILANIEHLRVLHILLDPGHPYARSFKSNLKETHSGTWGSLAEHAIT